MKRTEIFRKVKESRLWWQLALICLFLFAGFYLQREVNHFQMEKETVRRELASEELRFPKSAELLKGLREKPARVPWLEIAEKSSVRIISWEDQNKEADIRGMSFTLQGTYTQLLEVVDAWESGPPWATVRVENISPLADADICEMTAHVQMKK